MKTKKPFDGMNFMRLGYHDYIAARQLFLKGLIFPAMMSASYCVEKYLKALLAGKGVMKPVHLDRYEKLEQLLQENGIAILKNLDQNFIELLGAVYKFRYYDNITKSVDAVGFLVGQVLGELDYTVNHIETQTTITVSGHEGTWKSPYMEALDLKDEQLYEQNYLLNGRDKTEYMSEGSEAYVIGIRHGQEINTFLSPMKPANGYDGEIMILSNFQTEEQEIQSELISLIQVALEDEITLTDLESKWPKELISNAQTTRLYDRIKYSIEHKSLPDSPVHKELRNFLDVLTKQQGI